MDEPNHFDKEDVRREMALKAIMLGLERHIVAAAKTSEELDYFSFSVAMGLLARMQLNVRMEMYKGQFLSQEPGQMSRSQQKRIEAQKQEPTPQDRSSARKSGSEKKERT